MVLHYRSYMVMSDMSSGSGTNSLYKNLGPGVCCSESLSCDLTTLMCVCVCVQVADEMIQCVVCEDWLHGRVSFYSSVFAVKVFI